MCLSLYYPQFKWHQAKENMKVWKIVSPTSAPTPTVLSAIYNFPYRLGNKYAMPFEDIMKGVDMETNVIKKYNIHTGFHSYETKGRAKYEYREQPPFVRNACIAECTIPKGAMYVTDDCGCIVSNEIIIDRIDNDR